MSGIGSVSSQNPYANLYSALETGTKTSYAPPSGIEHAEDPDTVQRLWDEAGAATETLRNIVAGLLGVSADKIGAGQGKGQGYWAIRANPEKFNVNLKVDPELQAEAAEMIGENGYFGVKQTSDRILQFAKAMGGANAGAEQIESLRKAVQEGFDAVAKIFGGFDKLPDVTKETYDAVMKAFDEWAGAGAPAAIPSTETPPVGTPQVDAEV